jgi:hypothetical protein
MPDSLHDISSFIKINKDGQGYNPHFHTGSDVNGYTLYVHTAGGEKCLNSHAHTAGLLWTHPSRSCRGPCVLFSVVFTPPPPAIPAVYGSYLSSLYSLLTLHRGCGLAYPYYWRGFVGAKEKTSPLHVHTTGGGRDTPCTSILLVVEGIHHALQYYWLWKGYTMHVNTAGDRNGYTLQVHNDGGGKSVVEKDTVCNSKIHVVERDTSCTSIHS